MSKRATVLLLIPHLGGGGAERVTALLAGGLDPAKFEVHLGLVTQCDEARESIPLWVNVHCIGARRVRSGAWGILRLVRRLHPDVIFSGIAHLNLLVLLLRPLFPRGTRVIIRQSASLDRQAASSSASFWYRWLYPIADAVVCQTHAMSAALAGIAPAGGKLCVLPNPVDVDRIRMETRDAATPWTGSGPHLLAIGRLAPEKGFDLLLAAFAQLRRRYPAADLTILGEGRERRLLEVLAWVLGVGAAVRLAGHVRQPAAWFRGATLFVGSSRDDALPNALLEAAAAGLPIVTTEASGGVVELLRQQEGVWLSAEISANGILAAIEEALHSLQPGQRFPHPWVDGFRMERAVAAYEALIQEQLVQQWQ